MIVDTSALIAILRDEPEAAAFAEAIASADRVRVSAVNYGEAGAVLDRAPDPAVSRQLDRLLTAGGIEIESVTAEQAAIARAAYRDLGKGSGHPAGLNFGDCFAYALATQSDEPLLFKGDDFSRAGIKPAVTA